MNMLVEPGTRLAGRYELQARVSEIEGSTLWKAIDEPLARPVALRTLADDFPHRHEVISAARAASRVTDSRFAQVFDADERGEQAYLVSEWIDGKRLLDMLAQGPLDPDRATGFIGEVAGAVAGAHDAGIAHLRLDPACLMWAKGGTVKISGLAIEAALGGVPADGRMGATDSVTDARALGRLLYAALTAHWPSDAAQGGLPPAPRSGEHPQPARQLRPEVPAALEAVTSRAMAQPGVTDTLDSPAAVREALSSVPRAPSPAPQQRSSPARTRSAKDEPRHVERERHAGGSRTARHDAPGAGRGRRPVRAVLLGLVAMLILCATALLAWQVGRALDSTGGGATEPTPPDNNTQQTSVSVLQVREADDYDPGGDDGQENPDDVPKAVDGDPGTAWTTVGYNSANHGNLKDGVGLMLDMGEPVTARTVRLDLGAPGGSVELYAGDRAELGQMRQVASAATAGQPTELRPSQPEPARYLLVWFTKLPQGSDGDFRAEVREITVRGTG